MKVSPIKISRNQSTANTSIYESPSKKESVIQKRHKRLQQFAQRNNLKDTCLSIDPIQSRESIDKLRFRQKEFDLLLKQESSIIRVSKKFYNLLIKSDPNNNKNKEEIKQEQFSNSQIQQIKGFDDTSDIIRQSTNRQISHIYGANDNSPLNQKSSTHSRSNSKTFFQRDIEQPSPENQKCENDATAKFVYPIAPPAQINNSDLIITKQEPLTPTYQQQIILQPPTIGGTTPPNKQQSDEEDLEKYCRICKDDSVDEELITPCECSGSIMYVHNSCLYKWVEQRSRRQRSVFEDNFFCEICKYRFTMEIKSIFSFEAMKQQCNKWSSFKCLLVILFLLLIGFGFLIYSIIYIFESKKYYQFDILLIISIACLVVFGLIILVIVNLISLLYHTQWLFINKQQRKKIQILLPQVIQIQQHMADNHQSLQEPLVMDNNNDRSNIALNTNINNISNNLGASVNSINISKNSQL